MKDKHQLAVLAKTAAANSVNELRNRLRSHRMEYSGIRAAVANAIKQSSIGGDQETGFEQSFASLAYAYIQDKAPGLLDYMIGFQLVDRNEDNTKAIGVFGFKIAKQWMYVPVFFLSGDIKGHELLYLKNQDTFVPLKENWINYLVNKKPQILGEGTDQSTYQLGVQHPNLAPLVLPPNSGKYASVKLRPWANESKLLKTVAHLAFDKRAAAGVEQIATGKANAKLASDLDLRRFVKRDVRYVYALKQACEQYPGVKAALDVHYGADFMRSVLREMKQELLAETSKQASVLRKPAASQPLRKGILKVAAADEPKVMSVDKTKVITENLPELSEEERKKLQRDSYLIRDHRDGDEVSVAYNTQIPVVLSNPTETGISSVLVKPGEFTDCLVIVKPYSNEGRHNFCTVVRLGDNKNYKNFHPSDVNIQEGSRLLEKGSWFDELPAGTTDLAVGATYVAVSPSGQGTCPFEVRTNATSDTYEVYWKDSGKEHAGTREYQASAIDGPKAICCDGEYTPPSIVIGQRKSNTFFLGHQVLYVPKDAKIIKIADAPSCHVCGKDEGKCTCSYFSPERSNSSDTSPIIPGDLQDLQMQANNKLASLKIISDHSEVIVNGQRMQKLAGLFHLIKQHGFRETTAKKMLKEAERRGAVKLWVKYAQGFFPDPSEGGQGYPGMGMFPEQIPEASSMPYVSAPMMQPQVMQQQVPGLEAAMTDPHIYNPMMNIEPDAMELSQSASQSGQKQVFDTGMISSLIKAVKPDSIVDRDLGDLMKALDSVGRMLFLFYWHNEEFEDRYGKRDLPELEDTLRNTFESIGDLLLYLKQKTVQPSPGGVADIGPNIQNAARN